MRRAGTWGLIVALVSVSVPLFVASAASREQVAVTRKTLRIGKKTPPKSPPPPRVLPVAPGATGLPAGEGITEFRLVRVIPLTGQNPFNQRSPLNLTLADGRVVEFDTVAQLVAFQQGINNNNVVVDNNQNNNVIVVDNGNNNNNNGGGGGGGDAVQTALAACNGQTTAWAPSGTAPPEFRFAGIEINPNTGACRLRADGSAGLALIFQSPASGGTDSTRYEFFTDALEGIWTQVDPVAPPGGTVSLPGVVHNVTLQATTGLRVRIQFVVNGTNTNDFLLTVNTVTKQ